MRAEAKLREIVIPVVDFGDTTVKEVVDFLRRRTRELDASEPDSAKKGVLFTLLQPRLEGAVAGIDEELDAGRGA